MDPKEKNETIVRPPIAPVIPVVPGLTAEVPPAVEPSQVAVLNRITAAINSTLDLDEILNFIVCEVSTLVGADACYALILDERRDEFVLRAATGLNPESIGAVTIKWAEGITGWAAQNQQIVAVKHAKEDSRYSFKPESGEEAYTSLLAVPLILGGETIGVIDIQTREAHEFIEGEIQLMETVASQIVYAVRNARIYESLENRLAEMSTLYEVVRSIGTTLDLSQVLNEVVNSAARVLEAEGCVLRILDHQTGRLEVRAACGVEYTASHRRLGEGISGWVAENARSARVDDVDSDPRFGGSAPSPFKSVLTVPMLHQGRVIGTIGAYNKLIRRRGQPTTFTREDERILTILAHQASEAYTHAQLYAEAERLATTNQRKVKELTLLHQISRGLQGSLSLDEILFIILTGITSGKGLGYNRAIIMLVETKESLLKGWLGIGPTVEDVGRVWSSASARFETLEDYFESIDIETIEKSSFNQLVRKIELPVDLDAGLPVKAITEQRAFNIADGFNDPRVDRRFVDLIKTRSFAVVPIFTKELVIGAIVADNCFNSKPITDEDLQLLQTFANQAGLAIEGAKLVNELNASMQKLEETHRKLLEAEKMATVGEIAAGVAHDIRNPLVSIGGFTRRIQKKLEPENVCQEYVNIILKEVGRLEHLAHQVLDLAKMGKIQLSTQDVNAIVEKVVEVHKDECRRAKVGLTFKKGEIPLLLLDPLRIEQVLHNLVQNAREAIGERGGSINVATTSIGDHVYITVEDTAGAVDQEEADRLFEAFYTTKTEGTGLGLALAKNAVRSHGGEISLTVEPGKITSFVVELPVSPRAEMGG